MFSFQIENIIYYMILIVENPKVYDHEVKIFKSKQP